jgi:branched-chain amino acid transport system permease protein
MAVVEARDAISRPGAATEPWIALQRIHPAAWLLVLFLLFLPAFASNFVLTQLFGWSFILGMIALSLMFLAGYGGMVSLVQMTVAGCAGYMVAIFGNSAVDSISLNWPWWACVPVAVVIAVIFGTVSGALSVRTEGIYTIMITLAIASGFYYFTLQNYDIFNGFSGFNSVRAPIVLGIDWRAPIPFYYLCLFWAAAAYLAVVYVARAPFGLALQGTRDNARRMEALGFNVIAHRIAAYAFASLIAAVAGVLLVWQQIQISPGTAGIGPVVDILVIAVVGGIGRPIGPFIGAFIYVILRTFSLDVLEAVGFDGKRFQLLIGLGFLVIVLFSPDGVLGLWDRARARLMIGNNTSPQRSGGPS